MGPYKCNVRETGKELRLGTWPSLLFLEIWASMWTSPRMLADERTWGPVVPVDSPRSSKTPEAKLPCRAQKHQLAQADQQKRRTAKPSLSHRLAEAVQSMVVGLVTTFWADTHSRAQNKIQGLCHGLQSPSWSLGAKTTYTPTRTVYVSMTLFATSSSTRVN